MNGAGQRILATALAAVLVLAGWAALLAAFGQGVLWLNAPVDPERTALLKRALLGAFIVVSAKGLLPQVVLASGILALAGRAGRDGRLGAATEAAACFASALLAYAIVGPALLLREVAGLPALQHANALQHVGTALATSAGCAAALFFATRIVRRRRDAARAQSTGNSDDSAGGTTPGQIG
jgi:hypothetical protein